MFLLEIQRKFKEFLANPNHHNEKWIVRLKEKAFL